MMHKNITNFIIRNKVLSVIIIIIVFFIIGVFIPVLLNHLYFIKAPLNFLNVNYSIDQVLSFYGAILTFVGTSVLGAVTVYQNHVSQEKTIEINKLTLELQRKSMEFAEKNFEISNENNKPKFEININGYSGFYSNMNIRVKNISENIISGFKTLEFTIQDSQGNILFNEIEKVVLNKTSFASSDEIMITVMCPELKSDIKINKISFDLPTGLENIIMVWKFQCEVKSRLFYYQADTMVKTTENLDSNLWNIKAIG